MGFSATHTYAILEISAQAFEEISNKLTAAGYTDQFHDDANGTLIDMHGIAVQCPSIPSPTANPRLSCPDCNADLGNFYSNRLKMTGEWSHAAPLKKRMQAVVDRCRSIVNSAAHEDGVSLENAMEAINQMQEEIDREPAI